MLDLMSNVLLLSFVVLVKVMGLGLLWGRPILVLWGVEGSIFIIMIGVYLY